MKHPKEVDMSGSSEQNRDTTLHRDDSDVHEYQFTTDWFSWNSDNMARTLKEFVDKSDVRILEIGSWEGRSTTWFMTYLPHSTIVCIDTFEGGVEHQTMNELVGVEDRFLHNVRPFQNRITVRKGDSRTQLYGLRPDTFDIIYVDASHEAPDVLRDVVMCFPLLKCGGIMMMDDYAGSTVIELGVRLHHPQPAIDAFLDLYQEKLEVLFKEYQVYVRKLRD